MKRIHQTAAICIFLFSASLPAQELLLPAQPGDLTPEKSMDLTIEAPGIPSLNDRKETVHFSWPLRTRNLKGETGRLLSSGALSPTQAPHIARSRSYRIRTTGRELNAGQRLPISAPDALVVISPAGRESAPIQSMRLTLEESGGTIHRLTSDDVAASALPEISNTPFVPGTSAFRIRPEMGRGNLILRSEEAKGGDEPYVIQVVEKRSPVELRLRTGSAVYLSGETLTLQADLTNTDTKEHLQADRIDGSIFTPSGKRIAVRFRPSPSGAFEASVPQRSLSLRPGVLWEAEVDLSAPLQNGVKIKRSVRTSFACSLPTARLPGPVKVERKSEGGDLLTTLSVEVGTPGRYNLSGVLYGTDRGGNLIPIMISQTARHLTGDGTITLRFEGETIRSSGVTGPFEVRDLSLTDQSRLMLLQRRERAIAIQSHP